MADLYIGKAVNPADESLGERFLLDSGDLTTHGIVIGMTGSGKTGLSIGIIEELLKARIPVIVIDPKGDMGNLALAFDRLAPEQFEPWVDRDEARRTGKSAAEVATATAAVWTNGLRDWGIEAADVAAYARGRRIRIFTPGSTAGIPLNVVDSLAAPRMPFEGNEEELRDEIDSIVTGLLSLVKIDADPMSSREYILLFSLIEAAWRAGEDLDLASLIGRVGNPPMETVGTLPLETFYPQKDRSALMFALNNLLASPPFEAWRKGEPIDIEGWIRSADGVPQLSVVYTAHLDDTERLFITSLILNKLRTWMRRQPGTGELRALFYMDEIFGYFPPTENPPTKKPLLALLKQARAYGLGVLLSTQNPVDLDYKGLANMGFWAIGRLQTEQDQNRVRQGIEAALADSSMDASFRDLIASVQKRVFLVHDIHRKAPELVHSRFAMSYLRGPLTPDEIRTLGSEIVGARGSTGSTPVPSREEAVRTVADAPRPAGPPPLPSPMRPAFLRVRGASVAEATLVVRAAVRYRAGRVASDESQRTLAFRMPPGISAAELLEQEPFDVDEVDISPVAPPDVAFLDLPAFLASSDGVKALERALRERLDDRLTTELLYDPVTRTFASPGEDELDFAARIGSVASSSDKRRTLETRIAKLEHDIAAKGQEVKGRKMEKWMAVGTSLLTNLASLGGKSKRVRTTGMGSVLTKNRMENTAERKKDALATQLAALRLQLDELRVPDPSRFERRLVKPAKTDVAIIKYDIVWAY